VRDGSSGWLFYIGAAHPATLFAAMLAVITALTGMFRLPWLTPIGLIDFAAESRNGDPRHPYIPWRKVVVT
jgi:hypothetical protein